MPAAISGMELVQLLSLSHAGDCFATLAMTGINKPYGIVHSLAMTGKPSQ